MVWLLEANNWVMKANCLWVTAASNWVADVIARPRSGQPIAVRTEVLWVQRATDADSPTQWVDVQEANHLGPRCNADPDGT